MNEQPLVSVVIPNYNYARTLSACIEAVQRQTYPSIEIIVVDDHSTDDSVAIAHRYGVTVLETPVNSGVSIARNLGAENAKGQILFFLDSDVALDTDAVANAVAALEADPTSGAICGMDRAEPLFPAGLVKDYRAIQQYVWFGEIEGPIPGLHSALCAMRVEVFREIGPFNYGSGGPRSRSTASGSTPGTRSGPPGRSVGCTTTTPRSASCSARSSSGPGSARPTGCG